MKPKPDVVKIIALVFLLSCGKQKDHPDLTSITRERIYTADFTRPLDTTQWVTEIEPLPGSRVYTEKGKLVIDTRGGVTVWLRQPLDGNIEISYKRTVATAGGVNDRLSDLNQFWMAEDPRHSNLFTRQGRFEEYDSLRLYYVGMGGNSNTTTRFRKYDGNGNKSVIGEYLDRDHLLQAGKTYHIRIIVQKGKTSFWVDDKCYFTYQDSSALLKGYFGFRSVHSRQEIEDFKIDELKLNIQN